MFPGSATWPTRPAGGWCFLSVIGGERRPAGPVPAFHLDFDPSILGDMFPRDVHPAIDLQAQSPRLTSLGTEGLHERPSILSRTPKSSPGARNGLSLAGSRAWTITLFTQADMGGNRLSCHLPHRLRLLECVLSEMTRWLAL